MNKFETFRQQLRAALSNLDSIEVGFDEPVRKSGFWMASILFDDDYVIEVEWKRSLGFGLIAGHDLILGEGIHEIFDDPDLLIRRILELVESKEPTVARDLLTLAELRKLVRLQQSTLAENLGLSKGRLAQIENSDSIANLKVVTLANVISGLGGSLELIASFPDGTKKEVSIDQSTV